VEDPELPPARRLEGNDDWQEFDATLEAGPTLGGLGNIDHYRAAFPDGKPLEGMTFRLFNPRRSSGASTGRTTGASCSTRR